LMTSPSHENLKAGSNLKRGQRHMWRGNSGLNNGESIACETFIHCKGPFLLLP
jgi:hypothetical protein